MLNGKIAIVTGGTRGIGLAVVRTFLHNGAKVALFGSRETSVQIISREQEITLEKYLEDRKRLDEEMIAQMGELPKEKKKVDGPKVLYGRKISQSHNDPIGDLTETSGRVCIEGFVLPKIESKELRGGVKTLFTFGVTDYTGSILCKTFLATENGEGKEISGIKPGIRVKVRGHSPNLQKSFHKIL